MGEKNIIQAVVLANDFVKNLTPVENIFPSVLIPVINKPLLDYLVETLIKSRVEELFLYCSSHIDLIRTYVKDKNCSRISISLIISEKCRSLGDALRDIDAKGSIRGNFIFIRSDAFINTDLTSILNNHLAILKNDKGAAMTMVLRNIGSTNCSSLKRQTALVVSDKTSKKILHYSKLTNSEKKVKLELNWFLDHNEIEINTCFIDTHIYICSASVLPLFADNFDFETMEHFIRGVLMNEEILNSRIYWQQLNPEDYSLPIVSWNAYQTLNRDILNRHSYPLTPNAIPFLKNFIYMPRNSYKHISATLDKSCILGQDSIVCQKSTLKGNTVVSRSIIGNHSFVGNNARIMNSYISPGVSIDNECFIKCSIVFSRCSLGYGSELNGCIVAPGTKIDRYSEFADSILESNSMQQICEKRISDINMNDEFQFLKDHNLVDCDIHSPDTTSSEESSECNSPLPDDTNMFLSEVIDSLLRGFQDKVNCENLILEINSSRYAYNVTMNEVTYNVIKAILSLPFHYLSEQKETVNIQNYQKTLKIMITYFYPIILNYVKTEDAQNDCLRAIEEAASTTHELLPFLQHLLHVLYDKDVLSEDKILEWYKSVKSIDEFQSNKVRNAIGPFIKWLEEAEEDSSASEDD